MDISSRTERYRSIRMLLAGGSALATVMVLGTQAAQALTATAEELAALNDSTTILSASPVSTSAVWATPQEAANCDVTVVTDDWAAVRQYGDLAAVGSVGEATADNEAAPLPSYSQLSAINEVDQLTKPIPTQTVAAIVPAASEPEPAVETPRAQRVREFDELAAIDAADLDTMRGGFFMGGLVVQFGFELTNMLNGVVVNQIQTITPAVFSGGGLSNAGQFQITQTSQDGSTTTTTTGGLPTGLIINRSFNGGQTNMQFAINNGVMSLIQNSANSQTIQSLANINLNISGLSSTLRSALSNLQLMDALRAGKFLRH